MKYTPDNTNRDTFQATQSATSTVSPAMSACPPSTGLGIDMAFARSRLFKWVRFIFLTGVFLGSESNVDGGNLITNGSFEQTTDGTPSHWQCEGDKGVVQSLTLDHGLTSEHSAKLECTSFNRRNRLSYATLTQKGLIALQKGRWYRFSCWARAEDMASGMVTVELQTDTAGPVPYATTVLFMQMPVNHDWQRFEKIFKAEGEGTENAALSLYFDDTGSLWVDDVEVVEVAKPQPAFVKKIPYRGSKNLLPNGSFEGGSDRWSSLGRRTSWSPGLSALHGSIQRGNALDGDRCLRIEVGPGKTPVTTSALWPLTQIVQHAPLAANIGWIEVEKGKPLTVSAYLRSDKKDIPGKLEVHFEEPLGGGGRPQKNVKLTTQWQRYAITVPAAPSRFAYVAMGPDMTTLPEVSATVWVDAIQVEQATNATDFMPREPVELGFVSGKYGNVFDVSESASLTVMASNRTFVSTEVPLRITIEDYFDRVVSDSSYQVESPSRSTTSKKIDLRLTEPGFFRVNLDWEVGRRKHQRRLRFAVIETYQRADSVFGTNSPPSSNEGCEALLRAGVLWARDWSMVWQHIEAEPGKLDFTLADAHVGRILGTGMTVLQLFPFPSSDWDSTAPPEAEKVFPPYPRVWWKMAYPPRDPAAFSRIVTKMVQHYQGRIKVWEYLNEPLYTIHTLPSIDQMDASVPDLPGADFTVSDYISLLKVFYAAVKAGDPDAQVVGGLGGRPDLLTREFFQADGLQYLDKFNLHIYPGLRKPEGYVPQMQKLLVDMDKSGSGRKPIWFTEYSYFGRERLPWLPYVIGPGGWSVNRLLRDEKQCSDYSVRFAMIMLAHGAEKIFYHWGGAVSSTVNHDAEITESWMLDYGGTPRKLYAAQAWMAHILGPAPEFAASLKKPESVKGHGTEEVFGYGFQCGEQAVFVAWKTENDDTDWQIEFTRPVNAYNIVGAPLSGKKMELSESPVYITSTVMTADELTRSCTLQVVP